MKASQLTINQVRKAASEYATSDRQNPGIGCEYTTMTGEHCVAGQILTDLGVEVPQYGTVNNKTDVRFLFSSIMPEDVVQYLETAQLRADAGWTWAESIASAEMAQS